MIDFRAALIPLLMFTSEAPAPSQVTKPRGPTMPRTVWVDSVGGRLAACEAVNQTAVVCYYKMEDGCWSAFAQPDASENWYFVARDCSGRQQRRGELL